MRTFQFDYDNLPGIANMYAIPVDNFISVTKDNSGQDQISLKDSENAIMIPIIKNESFSFTENSEITDAGITYTPEISGIIPHNRLVNVPLIDELIDGEWLLLFQDSNGSCYLAGSVEVPLRFTYKAQTNAINGIKFTFTSVQSERAKILNTSSLSF